MPANSGQAEKTVKKKSKIINIEKKPIKKKAVSSVAIDPQEAIFALDIGTRTIVGVVGVPDGDKLKIVATEVVEHKSRAMMDGQIHDIEQVAEVTREVKHKLEKSLGFTLSRVAIAAAGRVLRTCEVKVEKDIEPGKEIDQEMVKSLEIEGIQLAQMKLEEEINDEDKTQYYCVGYSVINYFLNGYVISRLTGHKGKKIAVEILATFLPHIVVDSLYTVMGKVGLEVSSLTLEPIAAINVTIPRDLRLLNLALVDIGAGTSDIAITRDGSVVAYAMAPIAGDEITERIAQYYLVDFNTGEKIKTSLTGSKNDITFVDILGKKQVVSGEQVLEVIKPAVELLADTISQRILEYNHKAPNAVFLIGGGSQIPGLTDRIAGRLGIPEERVVVRGRDIIQSIKFKSKKLSGPEAITPFGIAVTAQMNHGHDFLSVTLNGEKIKLFNSKKLTVADALMLANFNPSELIGRTGKSLSFELNGMKKTVRGEHGKPAEIYINGEQASMDTVIHAGDSIEVISAQNGKDAQVFVSDFVSTESSSKVTLNGVMVDVSPRVYINGRIEAEDSRIHEGDVVRIVEISTIGDLLRSQDMEHGEYVITVNDREVQKDYFISNQDVICVTPKLPELPQESPSESSPEITEDFMILLEAQPTEEFMKEPEVNHSLEEGITVIVNEKPVFLKGNKPQFIFVDVFNFIDFDLSKPKGSIVLRLNGQQAAFVDTVRDGDRIEIYWNQ